MKHYPRDPEDGQALNQQEEDMQDARRLTVLRCIAKFSKSGEETQGDLDGLYLEESTIEDNNHAQRNVSP